MSALLKAATDACRWLESRRLGGEADAIAKELREALEAEPALIAQQAARIEELEKDAALLDWWQIYGHGKELIWDRDTPRRGTLRDVMRAIRQQSEGGAA